MPGSRPAGQSGLCDWACTVAGDRVRKLARFYCLYVIFFKMCGFKKSRLVRRLCVLNLRIRIKFCLVSSKRIRHPLLLRSFSWRAQCRWRHLWWRFPRRPWGLHEFLRRSGQRYVSHHLFAPIDGWQVLWYLGCYHEEFFGDVWHLPFQVLYLLCHVQTFWFV